MTKINRRNRVGVGNTLTIVGEITPPILTGNVDDYDPTGFEAGVLIRQDVDANNRVITGFPAPNAGELGVFAITNVNSASLDIRFQHNSGSSLVANRILLRDNTQKSLKPNDTGWFYYDHTKTRWIPANRIG
ncbi:hypothetical protein DRO66_00330 [Candidatus Bathyarchaeota archaeon]|nr:MAG: hypothetical protein DRO66_00330 [Candidatus Bathyarchaeota archaeon]